MRFALLSGEHSRDFVVIGGLNPDFLAPVSPVPHLGTTDVDLLFELGFSYERDELDFAWLDSVLLAGEFRARQNSGWQWDAAWGDARIRLDLLCDVYDNPGQTLYLPGAKNVAVQNLRGPAAALSGALDRALVVTDSVRRDHPDAPEHVELRFASLGGYLAAKSAALVNRKMAKDAYDLMFVVLYNIGGARAAGEAVLGLPAPQYFEAPRLAVRAAMDMMVDENGAWAGHFAEQMRAAGDDESLERLRRDASAGARRLIEVLE